MDKYYGIRYPAPATLLDHLDAPLFILDEVGGIRDAQKATEFRRSEELTGLLEEGVLCPGLDVLYMTRIQQERFFNEEDYLRLKDSYILTPEKLKNAKPDLRILHPLPRVNEISVAVDEDPRACYFKQVQYGKYIRMALILKLLNIA